VWACPPQEIAVIHNIKRTASIVSRENVECLVIDTDTCMRIFPDAINRDFENRLHHLRSVSRMHAHTYKHVHMHTHKHTYTHTNTCTN